MSKNIYRVTLMDKTEKHIGGFEVTGAKYDRSGNHNITNLISGQINGCSYDDEGNKKSFTGFYSRLIDSDGSYNLGAFVRYDLRNITKLDNVGSFVVRLCSDTSLLMAINGETRLCKVERVCEVGSVCVTKYDNYEDKDNPYVHVRVRFESYETDDEISCDYYYSVEEYKSLCDDWSILCDTPTEVGTGGSVYRSISGQEAMTLITCLKGDTNPPKGCF